MSSQFFVSFSLPDDRHYLVTNETGVIIKELFIAASDSKDWGNNLLGANVLRNGESGEILFHPDDHRCLWHVWVKDEEETELELKEIDLCKYTKIILRPDGVAEYA